MHIARTDESELLTVLHDGMHEQPAWKAFLGRLLRRVDADAVRLLLARGETGVELTARRREREVTTRPRPVAEADDPLAYGSLRPQRVYAYSEFQTPPAGAGRIVRIGGEDLDGWLVIHRDNDEFSASDAALLSALAPHFPIAFRNYAAVERDRLQRGVASWAMGRLGRGWLALTVSGRVVAADELAESMLREGAVLRRSAERRLLAASPAAHQRLLRAIEAAAAQPGAPPQAIRVAEEPRVELLIARIEVDPEAPIVGASLAAHVQVPPPAARDPVAALGELFDLTPAVARFACALGRTGGIAESAIELGLTLETARFYSKSLYAKVGARGQAELTRRLLTSVAALT